MTTLTFPGKSWGKYFDGYVRNIEIIFGQLGRKKSVKIIGITEDQLKKAIKIK